MKKVYALFLAAMCLSCSKMPVVEAPVDVKGRQEMTFYAESATKTSLQGNGDVFWTEGDRISVFSSSALTENECFVSSNINNSSASFTGMVTEGDTYYAVYPYSQETVSVLKNGSVQITLSVPSVQSAVTSGFDTDLNPSVAVTSSNTFAFKNIGALVGFTLPETLSGVKSVRLNSNDPNVKLSGDITVTVDSEGGFTTKVIALKDNSVKLEGTFIPGKTYYFVVGPATFTGGLSVLAEDAAGNFYSKTSAYEVTLASGDVLDLGTLELGQVAVSETGLTKVGEHYLISSADGLTAFAALVNGGERNACAILTSDIDMGGITQWTPIGNAAYELTYGSPSTLTLTGNWFAGEFDGDGHSIKNFKLSISPAGSVAYGLFGVTKYAVIKNLVLGDTGKTDELTVTSMGLANTVKLEVGTLAGICCNSRFINVDNYVKLKYSTTDAAPARITLGVVGLMFADGWSKSVLNDITNNVAFDVTTAYSGNQAVNAKDKAVQVGGIVGAVEINSSNGVNNVLKDCHNSGFITGVSGRMGGIMGGGSTKVIVTGCSNSARVKNDANWAGRTAGIIGVLENGNTVENVSNTGNVVGTAGSFVGGIICTMSGGNNVFNSCANSGRVVSSNAHRGLMLASLHEEGSSSVWTDCTAGGSLENGNWVKDVYTGENMVKYLYGSNNDVNGVATFVDLTYNLAQ